MRKLTHPFYRHLVIPGCLVLLVLVVFISLKAGYSRLTAADVLRILMGQGTENEYLILFSFRLPRILISALIGTGLAVSGCILQGITGNPLADPGITGIHAGAGLMTVLYAALVGTSSFAAVFTLPVLALAGAGLSAVLVYGLAFQKGEGITPVRFLFTGVAVQAGAAAVTALLAVRLDDMQYEFVASWQAGGIWGANWAFAAVLSLWIFSIIPFLIYKAPVLDILSLGTDRAKGLGVAVQRERLWLLAASVALSAACVSVGGNISFVGLIVPHITRQLVGPKYQRALPVCALMGAVLVIAADTVGRVINQPAGLPAGIVVSVLGAPYFLYLLSKRGERSSR